MLLHGWYLTTTINAEIAEIAESPIDSTRRREAAMAGREDQNASQSVLHLVRVLILSPCHPGLLRRPAASNRSAISVISALIVPVLSSSVVEISSAAVC
jgi:hypothetical protein